MRDNLNKTFEWFPRDINAVKRCKIRSVVVAHMFPTTQLSTEEESVFVLLDRVCLTFTSQKQV